MEVFQQLNDIAMAWDICGVTGILGRDAAWTGNFDSQYAVLEEDGYGLSIYSLENPKLPEAPTQEEKVAAEAAVAPATGRQPLDENEFVQKNIFNYASRFDDVTEEVEEGGKGGPTSFMFDTPVQRIFGSPARESTMLLPFSVQSQMQTAAPAAALSCLRR